MLVLRRFEVSTASAGILVAGSVSRESAPTLRPFRSLPSGRDLDVISEHVSVVAAEQPQYAVLRRNVLRDWIVKVQADVLIVRDTGKVAVDRRRLQVKQMLHSLKSGL
ncbi:MAG: hypothetical protein ACK5YX_12570 [Planctomyces sp.]